jgi:hypothetical protein
MLPAMSQWVSVVGGWLLAVALAERPGELLAATAVLLLAVAVSVHLAHRLRPAIGSAAARGAAALRERARRTDVPRQLDPDGSGRPRPRAPSACPSAV